MHTRPAYIISIMIIPLIVLAHTAYAQQPDRCGTMQRLAQKLKTNPVLKKRFFGLEKNLDSLIADRQNNQQEVAAAVSITIPVVFHIVLKDPSVIKDADIMRQLDVLNTSFAGLNPDSIQIPSHFKPLFGKSAIRFCLAARTPGQEITSGIVRYTTAVDSFYIVNDYIKHQSSGGADAWNTEEYMNVWVCALGNGITGFATLPGDNNPSEQGVVINVQTMPGGGSSRFGQGKTLVHETGHYLNLRHIWGDDNGGCTGSDLVDDTPNQAGASSGVISGIKLDVCSTVNPGIMYQNYMDYTDDQCLLMFTTQQVTRMEESINFYRGSLFNSRGCAPLVQFITDAEIVNTTIPQGRYCASSLAAGVRLRNLGTGALYSAAIHLQVDQLPVTSINWSGNLASLESVQINFPAIQLNNGPHSVSVYADKPNNQPDEDRRNDTLEYQFHIAEAMPLPFSENFENSFPPPGWQVINPDGAYTWERVTTAAASGNASVTIKNFSYTSQGETDELQLPLLNIRQADSVFLSFQVAAAVYTSLLTAGHVWDSLKILASTDCGKTFKTIYRKSGASLITRPQAVEEEFIPEARDWRKDSVSLQEFIGQPNLLLSFENINAFENNIYVDDVQVYTKTMNSELKEKGFLVTPNPATSFVTVKFYPLPRGLQYIAAYAMNGQKIQEIKVSTIDYSYTFKLPLLPSGIYILRAVFTDKVLSEKIFKK